MFNNFNYWNDAYKMQQDMMKSWADGFKASDKSDPFKAFTFPNFDYGTNADFFKQQMQMMEMWKKIAEENFKIEDFAPQLEKWQEMMENYNPLQAGEMMSKNAGEVFEKMMNSNTFYLNLYKVWQDMSKEILDPQSEKFKEEVEKAMKNYDKMILENFMPMLPKEIQGLFINPYNYIKTLTKSYGDFYGPWSDVSNSITDAYVEAILKDPSKMSDALRLWKEAYDKTFGALIKSPVIGNSRETIEQNKKMLDSLINFLLIASEFFTNISNVASKNSKKAFENYFELLKDGSEPKTFNGFYKFWSEKVENALDEYFYTDEFSRIIAYTVDAAMDFKKESDKATEKFLENYPIVTKSEIDSVYKNVYELKKEVRNLKKEIVDLKETLEKKETSKVDKEKIDKEKIDKEKIDK